MPGWPGGGASSAQGKGGASFDEATNPNVRDLIKRELPPLDGSIQPEAEDSEK